MESGDGPWQGGWDWMTALTFLLHSGVLNQLRADLEELGGIPVALGWEEALPGSGLSSNLSFVIASSVVLGKIL